MLQELTAWCDALDRMFVLLLIVWLLNLFKNLMKATVKNGHTQENLHALSGGAQTTPQNP